MQVPNVLRRIWSSLPWRRVHARTRAAVDVDWRIFGSDIHRVSRTGDLSPGGAFVRTVDPKSIDTPLVLELATPQGKVEVHARVAWTSPRGMGVRFMRPLPA